MVAWAFKRDQEQAQASRERQLAKDRKKASKREKRAAAMAAQVAASGLPIIQLPPVPQLQKKPKPNRANEVQLLRAEVKRLRARLEALLKSGRKGFYESPEWHKARYEALKRSNGCCELCGDSKANGAIIQVDHIKPRSKYPKLELDTGNLQVLCRACNMGKSNRDSIGK